MSRVPAATPAQRTMASVLARARSRPCRPTSRRSRPRIWTRLPSPPWPGGVGPGEPARRRSRSPASAGHVVEARTVEVGATGRRVDVVQAEPPDVGRTVARPRPRADSPVSSQRTSQSRPAPSVDERRCCDRSAPSRLDRPSSSRPEPGDRGQCRRRTATVPDQPTAQRLARVDAGRHIAGRSLGCALGSGATVAARASRRARRRRGRLPTTASAVHDGEHAARGRS